MWTGLGLACAGIGGGVIWLAQRSQQPEALEFTPGTTQDAAQILIARVLATNRPWLQPKPVRATYFFSRTATDRSVARAFKEISFKHLNSREKEVVGPLTARWKSGPDLRIGVSFETPLGAMLRDRSNFTVQSLGTTKWRGKTVAGVDVMFQNPVGGEIGMGAGNTHYSSCSFQLRSARMLIEPDSALPLFIGTSDSPALGSHPKFQNTFIFTPDFFAVPAGRAPRFVQWQMPRMSWWSSYEFQVTNGFWMFKRGQALIKGDRWSRFDHRLEMTRLQVEALKPGDLTQEYPTALTAGDASVEHARAWTFESEDVFRVSNFKLAVGDDLLLESGPADLGIGNCADGAVWAVLLPRGSGTLHHGVAGQEEQIDHIWLRFHPKDIGKLFPQQTISADSAENEKAKMCAIANVKMMSSWSSEGLATIPAPGQLVVDVDTKDGQRRFFRVDTEAGKAQYAAEFEPHVLNLSPEAIEVMSEPLPDHRQTIVKQSRDTTRPKVVSVQPAPGTLGTPPNTELRVRFDRPMNPLAVRLNWESGDCLSADYPRYDSNRFEFVISARLTPGALHQIAVNTVQITFGEGFLSAEGKQAALYVWRFTTTKAPAATDSASAPAAASATSVDITSNTATGPSGQELLNLLSTMQQRRAAVTSLVEHAQQVFQQHNRGFRSLCFSGATFKFRSGTCYYGDVSQIMGGLFRIGCDGQNWWWETGSPESPDLVVCPTNAMHSPDISIADPFELANDSPTNVVQALGLVYAGVTNLGGTDCYVIEARPSGSATAPRARWWINAQSYLVAEMESEGTRTRYLYESLSRSIPPSEFAAARPPGAKPARVDPLESGYTNRFINLRDGGDGRMSVRWGQTGPKGRSSSGLN